MEALTIVHIIILCIWDIGVEEGGVSYKGVKHFPTRLHCSSTVAMVAFVQSLDQVQYISVCQPASLIQCTLDVMLGDPTPYWAPNCYCCELHC